MKRKAWEQSLWDGLFIHEQSAIRHSLLQYKSSTIEIFKSDERGWFIEVRSNDGLRFTRMGASDEQQCLQFAKFIIDGE